MNPSNVSLFDIAARKMDWATARQQAISENIANADTPGYVGKDTASFEDHITQSIGLDNRSVETGTADNSWGGSFDGNQVVLEEQALLSSETASEFQMATKLYRMAHEMIALSTGKR
jgi:flagellar basal-body rod protein FlgB